MIPLHLFRAIKSQIPDRATRLAILRAKSGVAGLFRFDPSRDRIEINSIEFAMRCMAIK